MGVGTVEGAGRAVSATGPLAATVGLLLEGGTDCLTGFCSFCFNVCNILTSSLDLSVMS